MDVNAVQRVLSGWISGRGLATLVLLGLCCALNAPAHALASGPPAVGCCDVSSGGASSETITGTINPNGEQTDYYVEYGTSTSYGSQTPAVSAGSGTTAVDVSVTISGLTPGTTYHYRLDASNASNTVQGDYDFAFQAGYAISGTYTATQTCTTSTISGDPTVYNTCSQSSSNSGSTSSTEPDETYYNGQQVPWPPADDAALETVQQLAHSSTTGESLSACPTGLSSLTINWGDGQTSTPLAGASLPDGRIAVVGSHVYAQPGDYVQTVSNSNPLCTVADFVQSPSFSTALSSSTIMIGDIVDAIIHNTNTNTNVNTNINTLDQVAAHVVSCGSLAVTPITVSAQAGSQFSGSVASFVEQPSGEPVCPPTGAPYSAQIDWGDGQTSPATVSDPASVYSVIGAHTYANAGSYAVTVSVTGADGTTGSGQGTASVTTAATGTATSSSSSTATSGATATTTSATAAQGVQGATVVTPKPTPQPVACVSRRLFVLHVQNVKRLDIVSAVIYVDGREVRATSRDLSAPVDLRGLPKGTFVVRIVAKTASGRTVTGRRTYHTCHHPKLSAHKRLRL